MKERGRRGGWLGAIRVVLAFAMVGDLVYLATIPQNHTFYVGMAPLSGFEDPYGHDLPKDANLTIGFTEIGQRDYTTGEHLLYLAGHGLTLAVVTFPMMWLAMRLVGRAIDEDPFTLDMVRRLRVLGFVVLGGGLLITVTEYVTSTILVKITVPGYLAEPFGNYYPSSPVWWALAGFIILAVAGILRRGVAMRAELDEVI